MVAASKVSNFSAQLSHTGVHTGLLVKISPVGQLRQIVTTVRSILPPLYAGLQLDTAIVTASYVLTSATQVSRTLLYRLSTNDCIVQIRILGLGVCYTTGCHGSLLLLVVTAAPCSS